ncbi:peptidylprolyl isomerase [Chryseobacterium sp. PMSZPI]|uniref:peptidylprolyl isomerase n=1 Tax=Chryseobacterium sp. PMSZPI TaxID=1033900 RepID=UPI000C342747|nr:peptidylprolyl isomerase [Chryseobacterium sp. PMSZPI]PKF76098.1 peptidylprolyl isomerase [Chryseobacterium sp. PMSZPI]
MKKIFLAFAVFAIQLGFSQKVTSLKIEKSDKKELPTELDKDKITSYNANFFKFISALKASDKKTMEGLLSPKAKEVVTDVVYKKLSEDIDFKKSLEVYKSGYKSMMDGKVYPMIQYKYSDDMSPNTDNIVTAVFENDGKILGIKPKRKQAVSAK